MIRRLKQLSRRATLRRNGVAPEVDVRSQSLGDGTNAWTVASDHLPEQPVIYSFGVGTDISFDLAAIEQLNANVYAFDPTPKSVQWIKSQELPANLTFVDIGIAATDGPVKFFAPRRERSSHFTPVARYDSQVDQQGTFDGECRRLQTIMRDHGHAHIDILKIDIEGGEYDIIDDIVAAAPAIGQVLLEFHHMYSTISLSQTVEAVGRLRGAGFRLYHISDRTYEMSFVNQRETALAQ